MNIEEKVTHWLSSTFDQQTHEALKKLQQDPKKLEDAFYTNLAFGTGGMRGIMGVGTNRINKYTLGKNTQGLSNYLNATYPQQEISAVIAYDCRNNSAAFAKIVADVFTANGIKTYLFSDLRATPELSFAVRHLNAQCGIVLTASHNPPEYNGYKVYGKDGGQMVPPEDEAVMHAIDAISFEDINFEAQEQLLHYIDTEVDNAYQDAIIQLAQIPNLDRSDLKIVFTSIHGTSITAIPSVLEKVGYKNIFIVEEQAQPDGNFPTVSSPNPEEPAALAMALDLAKAKAADIIIGTDPDADRLGVVIKNNDGAWKFLDGNQLMIILTEYLLQSKATDGKLTDKHFIASTVVSSPAIEKMAAAYKVHYFSYLTGFKWIAKGIQDHPHLTFVGGGEESFGYLIGDAVRDKDAISACLLACEIAALLKSKGETLEDLLYQCYKKYGVFREGLVSLTKKGKDGAQEIADIMEQYRQQPPSKIGATAVRYMEDFGTGVKTDTKTGEKTKMDYPASNVLIFYLEDGSRIALRPSGTEPKIKYYFSVTNPYDASLSWETAMSVLDEKIDTLKNNLSL